MPKLKQAVPAGRTDIPVPGESMAPPLSAWRDVCDHGEAPPDGYACTCFCRGCQVALKGSERCICPGCICGNRDH